MAEEPGIFEVMYHCRAMRRLKPDPVPEALLVKLIDAASRAPSGGNRQAARWILVCDPAQKAKLAELNRNAVRAYAAPGGVRAATLPHQDPERRQRQLDAVLWQAEHMQEIPVLIVACLEFEASTSASETARGAGSIWPAIQNLLLAARALGLGATPTTLALMDRKAFKEALGLPAHVEAYCLIPVGYPLGRFGPVTRLPVEQTLRWDRWQ